MEILECSMAKLFVIKTVENRRAHSMSKTITTIVYILFCLLFCPYESKAQNPEDREGKIKAATLYYLTRFTSWPTEYFNSENKQLTVCIIGKDTINGFLESINNKDVNGLTAKVMFIDENVTASEEFLKQCAILYVGQNTISNLANILKAAQYSHTLTIGTETGFTHNDGMVHFGKNENKIQLTINIRNVRRASLVISSDILELAHIDGLS